MTYGGVFVKFTLHCRLISATRERESSSSKVTFFIKQTSSPSSFSVPLQNLANARTVTPVQTHIYTLRTDIPIYPFSFRTVHRQAECFYTSGLQSLRKATQTFVRQDPFDAHILPSWERKVWGPCSPLKHTSVCTEFQKADPSRSVCFSPVALHSPHISEDLGFQEWRNLTPERRNQFKAKNQFPCGLVFLQLLLVRVNSGKTCWLFGLFRANLSDIWWSLH